MSSGLIRRLSRRLVALGLAAGTLASTTAAFGFSAPPAAAAGRCPQDASGGLVATAPHVAWSPTTMLINQAVLQQSGRVEIPILVRSGFGNIASALADTVRGGSSSTPAQVILSMRVDRDDAVAPGFMRVDLDTAPAVTWDKAIRPRNDCSRVRGLIYKTAAATGPATMTIENAGADRYSGFDTLEIHKPGFLGIWGEVAEIDRDQMWALGSGNRVTFTWLSE